MGKSTSVSYIMIKVWDFVYSLHPIHLNKVWSLEGLVLRSRPGSLYDLIDVWHFTQSIDSIHLPKL